MPSKHAPHLDPKEHDILREYFRDWKINDVIDALIYSIPFDQQRNMVNNLTKAKQKRESNQC